MPANPLPVILDTDIGGDIDDTWALGLLLRSPELKTKLVVTATADTFYRARLTAKFLDEFGRADIPLAAGIRQPSDGPREKQKNWVGDYQMSDYPQKIREDGVQALIDCVKASPEPVTLIAIGPLPNVAEALRRAPEIAGKCRFVAMQGSIRRGHENEPKVIAEYNVVQDIAAAQVAFSAPWLERIITPLDSCGSIRLTGARYQAVARSTDPLAKLIVQNYRCWLGDKDADRSSILYDTVAVYLAFADEWLEMEELGIRVDDAGFTRIDPAAPKFKVATGWRNQDAFLDFLVERLTKGGK